MSFTLGTGTAQCCKIPETNEFEVEHHFVIIEGVCLEDELYFTGVAVREAAFIRVLREKVAVFDLDRFANSVRHYYKLIISGVLSVVFGDDF